MNKNGKQSIHAWPPVEGAKPNIMMMGRGEDIADELKKRTQELNQKKKRRRDFRMKKLNRPTWFQIETPHSPPGDRKPRTNFKDHPRLVEHRKREAAAVEESKKLIHADILKTKAVSKKAIFSQTKELKQWKSNTNHW